MCEVLHTRPQKSRGAQGRWRPPGDRRGQRLDPVPAALQSRSAPVLLPDNLPGGTISSPRRAKIGASSGNSPSPARPPPWYRGARSAGAAAAHPRLSFMEQAEQFAVSKRYPMPPPSEPPTMPTALSSRIRRGRYHCLPHPDPCLYNQLLPFMAHLPWTRQRQVAGAPGRRNLGGEPRRAEGSGATVEWQRCSCDLRRARRQRPTGAGSLPEPRGRCSPRVDRSSS